MALPPTGRISCRARRRTVAAAGAAQPAVGYGFGLGRVPRTSSSRVDPPPRVSRPRLPLSAAPSTSRAPTPVPTVPIPTDRDRAEPLGLPLLWLSTPSESPSAPVTDFDLLGTAAELHFGGSAARHSHAHWEREQLAEPTCYVAIQHSLLGRPLVLSAEVSARTSTLPSRRSKSSLAKVASILPTRTMSCSSVIQPRPTTPYCLRGARLAFWATNQSVFTCRYSCALGSCKHAIRLLPSI